MMEQKRKNKIRNILIAVLSGLVVAGFWVFANPVQKTSITAPVENGLVGYWNMDSNDISGTTLYDKSGKGNNGTIYGATTGVPGKIKQALSFDGVDDYVSTPVNLNWSEGSIVVWANSYDLNNRNLFVYTADDGLTTYTHQAGFITTGKIHVYFWDGTRKTMDSVSSVSSNTWYHIAVTWKDNDYVKLFVNGNFEGQVAIGTAWKNGNKFLIGKNTHSVSGLSNYAYGLIDEVRIYNRALSPEEIKQNYEASKRTYIDTSLKGRFTDGLVGYWTFDGPDIQGLNATATDVSGNGNNGTIKNGAFATIGKIGQALSFDGVDDYVSTPVNLNWSEGSIVVWANSYDLNNRNLFVYTADDGLTTCTHQAGFITTGKIHVFFWDGAAKTVDSVTSVSSNTWYHIAVTWKDNDYVKLFVNGNFEGQVAIGTAWKNGNKFLIGKNAASARGLPNYTYGLIDEVRIYNRALSEDEIRQHYQAGMRRMEIQ